VLALLQIAPNKSLGRSFVGRIVSMVIYRPVETDDYEAVQKFLADIGWAARVSDVARLRAMLA
jgi:hypothetical protein